MPSVMELDGADRSTIIVPHIRSPVNRPSKKVPERLSSFLIATRTSFSKNESERQSRSIGRFPNTACWCYTSMGGAGAAEGRIKKRTLRRVQRRLPHWTAPGCAELGRAPRDARSSSPPTVPVVMQRPAAPDLTLPSKQCTLKSPKLELPCNAAQPRIPTESFKSPSGRIRSTWGKSPA
jgi:hypothetical protein